MRITNVGFFRWTLTAQAAASKTDKLTAGIVDKPHLLAGRKNCKQSGRSLTRNSMARTTASRAERASQLPAERMSQLQAKGVKPNFCNATGSTKSFSSKFHITVSILGMLTHGKVPMDLVSTIKAFLASALLHAARVVDEAMMGA